MNPIDPGALFEIERLKNELNAACEHVDRLCREREKLRSVIDAAKDVYDEHMEFIKFSNKNFDQYRNREVVIDDKWPIYRLGKALESL
jgi:hypothetical protein